MPANGPLEGRYFRKETAVQKPAQTPMFFDCVWWYNMASETDPPSRDLYYSDLTLKMVSYPHDRGICLCAIARHGNASPSGAPRNVTSGILPGSINMGFGDGHVELVKVENLWTFHWGKDWDPNKVPWPHPAPK